MIAALLLLALSCPAGQMEVCATVPGTVEACTCVDTYSGEEPVYLFAVAYQGEPQAGECNRLTSRMREELRHANDAGRKVTRATMPQGCRQHSDARSYRVADRSVPVHWVKKSQLIAAWARKP